MKITSYRALYINNLPEERIREKEQIFQETLVNSTGQPFEEKTFSSEGELESKYLFSYNDQGNLIKEILEEADGGVTTHREIEYDEQNRLVKEYFYYADDSEADVTHCYYDENGLLIRKETINSDNELETSDEFVYQNKKIVSEIQRDSNKKNQAEKHFNYDENGNLIEEHIHWFNDEYRQVYEYDENQRLIQTKKYNTRNQLIERLSYTENESHQVSFVKEETVQGTVLRTYQYDESGNIILQEEHSENGDLKGRTKRTFENKNLQTVSVYVAENEQKLAQEYRIRYEYE